MTDIYLRGVCSCQEILVRQVEAHRPAAAAYIAAHGWPLPSTTGSSALVHARTPEGGGADDARAAGVECLQCHHAFAALWWGGCSLSTAHQR
eukprot:COSAG02_NODE_47938_length_337_cov_1.214286_1_plen_91_part_10